MWNKLSATQVQRLRHKIGLHSDGGNLYLQVKKPPAASWVLRYKLAGQKERWMGLGPLDLFSLADARQKAHPHRQLIADGKDPLAIVQAATKAARAAKKAEEAKAVTFEQAAQSWYNMHESRWRNPKVRIATMSALKRWVYPHLAKMVVGEIGNPDILRVMEQPVEDGSFWTRRTETATKVRGFIEEILDWCTARHLRHGPNPAAWSGNLDQAGLLKPSIVAPTESMAALPYPQLPAFMAELATRPAVAARALEFCILTATRTQETIGAQWAEIDLDKGVWCIPAARMKMQRPHKVPLSKQVVALLRSLPRERGNEFVFLGGSKGRPLSNMAMMMLLRDRMGRTDITVHGFRSSFKDYAAEQTNAPNIVSEMALAHKIPDKVEAAYRRGDLFEKRRRLMNAWATFACTPAKAANVVSLEKRRA